jgi:hypothetical protein
VITKVIQDSIVVIIAGGIKTEGQVILAVHMMVEMIDSRMSIVDIGGNVNITFN